MPDQPATPLTDDELRDTAANGWAPHGARIATELLAARARIAELEAALKSKRTQHAETLGLLEHAYEVIESVQRPPLGYAVTSVHILDGSRCVHANPILDRAAAQEHARAYASARVVELREVQP